MEGDYPQITIWKHGHIPKEYSLWRDATGQRIVTNIDRGWAFVYFGTEFPSNLHPTSLSLTPPITLEFVFTLKNIKIDKFLQHINEPTCKT